MPPKDADGSHLGVPVLQRRLRLQDLHLAGRARRRDGPARGGPYPKGALGDWISPAMVTRGEGRRQGQLHRRRARQGLHRQQGRPLAARRHQRADGLHDAQAPADEADRAPPASAGARQPRARLEARELGRGARSGRGRDQAGARRARPVVDRAVGGRPSLAGDELRVDQAVLRGARRRVSTTPRAGPTAGVAVRAIHNRPKWNSEHPIIAEHFGSSSTLLYSYRDFELADTVLLSGANSYETGTVLYNRMHARKSKKVVIDPRRTVPAKNAEDLGGVHLQLRPNTDVVLVNSLMNVILRRGPARPGVHRRALRRRQLPAAARRPCCRTSTGPRTPRRSPACRRARVRRAARLLGRPKKTSILFEKGVIWSGHPERRGDELLRQPGAAARQHRPRRAACSAARAATRAPTCTTSTGRTRRAATIAATSGRSWRRARSTA